MSFFSILASAFASAEWWKRDLPLVLFAVFLLGVFAYKWAQWWKTAKTQEPVIVSDDEHGFLWKLCRVDVILIVLCVSVAGLHAELRAVSSLDVEDCWLYSIGWVLLSALLAMLPAMIARLIARGQCARWVSVLCSLWVFCLYLAVSVLSGQSGASLGDALLLVCAYKFARCCSLGAFVPDYIKKALPIRSKPKTPLDEA